MAKTSDQSQCRLFTLSAELRNEIYELAFTVDMEEPIELLSAVPPANSLILTCRRVCNEAAGMYRQTFWTTGHFRLATHGAKPFLTAATIVRSASVDWEHMRNIRVNFDDRMIYYMPEHGVWEYKSEYPSTYISLSVPKGTDATSMLPYEVFQHELHKSLDEALLASKGRRGRMVNQLCTFAKSG
ncbi:hypothetical protein LTR10_010878 [Elasticomyces elasticus]|nr:hypothetical protein LTR10_010878 [Elasticomyces elasticus]KAK4968483.1 hypothetical protein LTR42_009766 [Elasticomyces elasticus]